MRAQASWKLEQSKLLYRRVFGGRDTIERLRRQRLFRELFELSQENIRTGHRQLVIFSQDFIGHHVNIDGTFELLELNCLFEWLTAHHPEVFQGVALDVGANIGNHALYFSRYFEKVYAFEPSPRTFRVLEINASLVNNVSCFELGVSDSERTAYMTVHQNNMGHAAVSEAGNDSSPVITLKKLDSLVDPSEPIRLIKIDVEGHEHSALLGAEQTIKRHRPVVLFEQLASEVKDGGSPVLRLLRDFGYTHFASVDGATNKLHSDRPWLRALCNLANRILIGKSFYLGIEWSVRIQDHFPTQDYPFIVALPDWLLARSTGDSRDHPKESTPQRVSAHEEERREELTV